MHASYAYLLLDNIINQNQFEQHNQQNVSDVTVSHVLSWL